MVGGKLTLGRQYMPHWSMNANTYAVRNPFAAEVGFLGNNGFKRINNVARYQAPTFGGVTVTGAVILKGEADTDAAAEDVNATNLLVQYKGNGLSAAISFAETNVANSDDTEIWGLSAKYKIDALTLMARYEESETGSAELESTQLAAHYKIGNTTLKASWNQIEDQSGADGDSYVVEAAHKLGKGEVYVGFHGLEDVTRVAGGTPSIDTTSTGNLDTTYVGYLVHF